MPWWPEEWILGRMAGPRMNPAAPAQEDWSLLGRLTEWGDGHSWGWHRDLAMWRGDMLVRPDASAVTLHRALVISQVDHEPFRSTPWPLTLPDAEQQQLAIQTVARSIDRPDRQTWYACQSLFRACDPRSRPVRLRSHESWVAPLIEPEADRIFDTALASSHLNQSLAIQLLAYMPEHPRLVDVLHEASRAGSSDALSTLVRRAEDSGDARRRVVSLLFEPRRAVAAAQMIHRVGSRHPDYGLAASGMLASPERAVRRGGAIMASRLHPPNGPAEHRLAELVWASGEDARYLTDCLSQFDGAIERHAVMFLRMSHRWDSRFRLTALDAFQMTLGRAAVPTPTPLQRQVLDRLEEMAEEDPSPRVQARARRFFTRATGEAP
jgi:hypothetical protein